jgi:hypothetical protein
VASRPEVAVDHRVRRQEPLCLTVRFEPLHLSLSSSRGIEPRIAASLHAIDGHQRSGAGQGQDGRSFDRSISNCHLALSKVSMMRPSICRECVPITR